MKRYRIAWNDKLMIGCEVVDSQHKKLVELIGSIPEYETDRDVEALTETLQYVSTHFSDEEKFMEEIGYPELKHHQNIHKKLTRILLSYKKEYDDSAKDMYSFKQFMFHWVRDHIMDEDRKIGLFAQTNRQKPSSKPADSD
ncbi:MAG: bacteriohemerythrin [Pontiellaceae bacterium]|nr:bacteriohemerythrin [Pontiellaceae bacterium]